MPPDPRSRLLRTRDRLARAALERPGGHRALATARRCIARLVEMELVDRSIAIASLTFTAAIPLLVVLAAYLPGIDRGSVADSMISRFALHGSSADLVRQVFAPPSTTRETVSIVGIVLLAFSALSFTRGLQRVYERAWRLPSLGIRATPSGLRWLAGLVAWAAIFRGLQSWLLEGAGPVLSVAVALTGGFVVWWFTPAVLLGGRVAWRRLVPTAALTAAAMTGLSAGSVVYMPHAIGDAAARYGPIGIAIALVSWLVACGFVVVSCAGVGAVLAEPPPPPPADRPAG